MRRTRGLSLILLVLCAGLLVLPAAGAGAITMTAGSSDYYFGLGESADVPVAVTSSYDHNIDGTLQFSTTEQLQSAGMVMMSTKNKVYSHTVPPGDSAITLSAGTSSAEKTVKVDVAFDYTDPSAIHVSLPEIRIHFVKNPQQSSGSQSPVTSTSSAGTGNVPASSSVQIVQQTVSAQQQAGRDGTVQQALQNSQMAQDTGALKEQLQREAEKNEQDKAAFLDALSRDPLLASVNASLAADGFTRVSQSAQPSSGTTGTFSQEYRNAAGATATVTGSMENGIVPSVIETSQAPVNVTAPLAANTTYRTAAGQLSGQDFSRNMSTLTFSAGGGAMVNLTYQDPLGKRAFVNATTDGTNVTQLEVAVEPDVPFDYVPVLAAVAAAAVVLATAWVLYRRFRRMGAPALLPLRPPATREPFDHRKVALKLLQDAETAYEADLYPDACSHAARALRLFLAWEHGACREMTTTELLAFLPSKTTMADTLPEILDRCSDVEFARGILGPDEFPRMAAAIRSIIEGKR